MAGSARFLEIVRRKPGARPVAERIRDWREVTLPFARDVLREQASRCMDCGIPFCHDGCPLGNHIPEWNGLAAGNRWRAAIDALQATNNFPEITGRVCPAPCEEACVLSLHGSPVTIKATEYGIAERAFSEGWIAPKRPPRRTGRSVAVVGSGPAGLAAADQLNQAGHLVTVLERAERPGGLLRYGIPEFKLEKSALDRRLALLEQEGITFVTRFHAGVDVSAADLLRRFDAIVLATGAAQPRDLDIPGRHLSGIHFAMDYLTAQNRRSEGADLSSSESIDAAGKRVIIIGGGDTGADCLGTAIRQGAASVTQLELMPRPPAERPPDNPWPAWPNVFRVSHAHEEGGERLFSVSTTAFSGTPAGHVRSLQAVGVERRAHGDGFAFEPIAGSELELPADLVILGLGFSGPQRAGLLADLDLRLTPRGNVWRDTNWMTSVAGVFVAGDMHRGPSLVVWAIADGRSCAHGVDTFLTGHSALPRPVA